MSEWVVIAVDQQVCWVEAVTTVSFLGRDLVMRPPDGERWADVSIARLPGESYFAAGTVIRRFLSAVAWRWTVPIREIGQSGGTQRTRVGGRLEGPLRIFPGIEFSNLPQAVTLEQERALALYRDALNLEPNHTYKFLALFRIFGITLPRSEDQKNWINQQLGTLIRCQGRVKELQATHNDVGAYLYYAGRSALAHAFQPPLIDPDVFDDTYRINLDLPVVEELIELYMEQGLGLRRY